MSDGKVIIEESRIDYEDNGYTLEGFICMPKEKIDGKLPAVLVCHAFSGITDFEEGRCRALAKHGFIAFAADVYGKGKRAQNVEECFALMKPYREDRTKLLRGRLLAALDRLKACDLVDAQRVAVIGYCFGGLCALDLARINASGLQAAVSFHGSFAPLPDQPDPKSEAPINSSVLICHGDADTHVPAEQCESVMAEMRARRADWQFIHYGNAKHGFTEPKLANSTLEGVGYNAQAAERSWAAMLELFRERLNQSK